MAIKRGGTLRDILNGTSGIDKIFGLDGNDSLYGGAGGDFLYGGAGGDVLYGGAGNDTLRGGTGNDRIFGGSGNELIAGNAGHDRIFGGVGNDRVFGNAGNDKIDGGAGDDTLDGGDGNDTIDGGDGLDVMTGGTGDDTIVGSTGQAYGGMGNDSLTMLTGLLYGGAGDDTLTTAETGLLYGGDGNDVLQGGDGGNTIYGGTGDDIIYGGRPNGGPSLFEFNFLYDGEGSDQVSGSSSFSSISHFDRFVASPDATPDVFDGRAGSDTIAYDGDPANPNVAIVVYVNAPGVNTGVTAGDVYLNIENVLGLGGDDQITLGGGGYARGGGGNDVLESHGNDGFRETLIGDAGNDIMGPQDFNADGITYRLQRGFGDDTINSFKRSVSDRLQVSLRIDDDDKFGGSFVNLVNQTDNVATTGLFTFIFETDTDILWFDIDGNGASAPEKIATLPNFFLDWGNMLTSDFDVLI
jgi:RTX calcium-binding nonapeptide repeat (4 copies)